MNCEKTRRAILLAQSGELPAGRQRHLDAHLAGCAACRAFHADAGRILTAARTAPPEATIGGAALRRIEAAAAEPGRRQTDRFAGIWRPALVAATAAALALWLAVSPRQEATPIIDPPAGLLAWDANLDEAFASLETLLATAVDENGNAKDGDNLDRLAEELIELESWSI